MAVEGKTRVYADPQPGRAVMATHSRDRTVGKGRIDSQHDAVAELVARAERAAVGARQRLAFATLLLEDGVRRDSGASAQATCRCSRGA